MYLVRSIDLLRSLGILTEVSAAVVCKVAGSGHRPCTFLVRAMAREYDPTCVCAGRLEAALLPRMESLTNSWGKSNAELFALLRLSIPVSANYLLNRLVSFSSILFVGHLGPAELAAAALGGSLTNVIGLGILGGLVGGMSTLCGQASFCSAIILMFARSANHFFFHLCRLL